jgi:ferredoxin-NADP reductase
MTEAIPATARWQSCAIVEVATRTRAIKSFFLRLSKTFDYTAGQHVDVRLTAPDGYTAMRSYSIASAPSGSQVIELAIERLADGEVSPFFHDVAQVGDTIELRGPLGGHFLWPGPSNKSVLLIGAGSGIVPLMAMIRHRKASGEPVPVALLLAPCRPDLFRRVGRRHIRPADVHSRPLGNSPPASGQIARTAAAASIS